MMGSETPSGVLDGSPDGVGDTPSGGESFSIKTRMVPRAYGGLMTPVGVYATSDGAFIIGFGDPGSEFSLMTNEAGLDVIVGALLAAKVRAAS